MEENLSPQREARTVIIEKPLTESSVENLNEQKTTKEEAKKILFQNSPEKYMENLKKSVTAHSSVSSIPETKPSTKIEFEATKTFVTEDPKKEIETITEVKIETKTEIENETEIEEKTEQENDTEPLTFANPTTNIDNDINPLKRVKPKVGLKKRLKIITFGFFAILTCLLGWSIYNGTEIETLRAQLEDSNKTYSVNLVNYINNLSKVDDGLTPDSLFNIQDLSNAGIIPLEPTLATPVEYSIKSNWFDKLCNWLSGIIK